MARSDGTAVWVPAVLFTLLYRLRLFYTLYHVPAGDPPILGFLPARSSRIGLAGVFFQDFLVCTALAVTAWAVLALVKRLTGHRTWDVGRVAKHMITLGTLLAVAIISGLHYSLLWHLHKAPTRMLLAASAGQAFSPDWYANYVTATDLLFLLAPLPLYAAFLHLRLNARLLVVEALAALALISAPLHLAARREDAARDALLEATEAGTHGGRVTTREIPEEIRANPVRWFVKSVLLVKPSRLARNERLPGMAQRSSVAFVDRAFVVGGGAHVAAALPRVERTPSSAPWNVLFFVVESLGARYLALDGGAHMPNLAALARDGVNLLNHRSTGVDTDFAVFSIYTGLYPIPESIQFVDRGDLRLPTIFSALPGRSTILVTPSDLRLWFPIALLKNTGLTDIWDTARLPTKDHALFVWNIKDEVETVGFFLDRLGKMKEPFTATYYAYATHSPYLIQDQGPSALADHSDSRRDNYVHNVELVDRQLGRVVESLRASGVMDRTILVVLADHGEAFGEHLGSFGHGLHLYDETVHVPAVLYQPKVFPPAVVTDVTSHVDILPTLLDAIGERPGTMAFEGESLFRLRMRKYVFFYSPKGERLGSLSREQIKMIVDYARDRCQAFDLAADPGEQAPLGCDRFPGQLADLGTYHRHQRLLLLSYQDACLSSPSCAPLAAYH